MSLYTPVRLLLPYATSAPSSDHGPSALRLLPSVSSVKLPLVERINLRNFVAACVLLDQQYRAIGRPASAKYGLFLETDLLARCSRALRRGAVAIRCRSGSKSASICPQGSTRRSWRSDIPGSDGSRRPAPAGSAARHRPALQREAARCGPALRCPAHGQVGQRRMSGTGRPSRRGGLARSCACTSSPVVVGARLLRREQLGNQPLGSIGSSP